MTRREFMMYVVATAALTAKSYFDRMAPYRKLDNTPTAYPEAADLIRAITVLEPTNGLFIQNHSDGRQYKAGVHKETFADMLYLLATNIDPESLGHVDQATSVNNLMRFVNQLGFVIKLSGISNPLKLASYDELGDGGPKITIDGGAFNLQIKSESSPIEYSPKPLTEIFVHELVHLWQDANFPNLVVGWRHLRVLSALEAALCADKATREVIRRTPLGTKIEDLSKTDKLAAAALKTTLYGGPALVASAYMVLNVFPNTPLETHAAREARNIARLWEEKFPGRQLLTLDPV